MVLLFGQLLAIADEMHPSVETRIVQARIKYLQQLETPFPSDASSRRGRTNRVAYPVEDLPKLILALELMAAGVPPHQAANMVQSRWSPIVAALAKVWTDGGGEGGCYILATPDGLDARRGAAGRLEIADRASIGSWLTTSDVERRRLLVLDLSKTMAALRNAVTATHVPRDAEHVMTMLDEWVSGRR